MKPAQTQLILASILAYGFSLTNSQSGLCTTHQIQFAEKQTEFMNCAIMNSEPVEYCVGCNSAYLSFLHSYDVLMGTFIMQNNKNISCRSLLVDKDRLNLIENINSYTRNVWKMGYCSDCFDCDLESVEINCTLTKETTDFIAKFNATSRCISINLSDSCVKCLADYQALNSFYDNIRAVKGDKFCFDTRDKMNKTQILWSNELHCCGHRDSSKSIFFILSSAAIAILIAFYLGVFVIEKRIESRHFHIPNDLLESTESPDAVTNATEQNDLNKPSTSSDRMNRSNRRRHTDSDSSNDTNDDDDDDGPMHNKNLAGI